MNSYCLESPRPFKPYLAERAAKELLETTLQDVQYEGGSMATALAVKLAAELREKLIELDFLRYKLMVTVHITERINQGINSCMRFLWDEERDNFAIFRYENTTLVAVATMFAVYYD